MAEYMKFKLDWNEYAKIARTMAAEGCVLLRNDDACLPIRKNETVSVFGRIQFNYYKSGTGSGGMINVPYVVNIIDALKACEDIRVNRNLLGVYEEWVKANPYENGAGWAMDPWSQEEMPLSDEIVEKASKESDIAVVIIGRTAGEEKDNSLSKGSYLLSDKEEDMIRLVTKHFKRTAVLLNVGNIIDMSWVEKYSPSSVMYVWQGGCEGGNGVCDVLTGRVNPSGHLADTIARNIEDYPSDSNFGDSDINHYEEDIYVGYRYFETAAKDKVLYPFGYGLSYSDFYVEYSCVFNENDEAVIEAKITNNGEWPGKEVIQVYYESADGHLKKSARALAAFAKTDVIAPGESHTIRCSFALEQMASYDDTGVTGNESCFVLEAGEYGIYAGENVRDAQKIGSYILNDTVVVSKHEKCCTPVTEHRRMVIDYSSGEDNAVISYENVPLRDYDLAKRIKDNLSEEKLYTGDRGLQFIQYLKDEISLDDYLAQFDEHDLICLSRGEGMNSPKVTPGIAGCFGGVTKKINEKFGMPIAGCSDGPSGIRMDCGTMAFALPNGTMQACSFNTELIEHLYEYLGRELRMNKIDSLLGPGMNIHRHPLNGRNFEYYSEDPYLTGMCAAAELKGLHKYGVTGTIKHFATNNQETRRHFADAVVSERALREIYLRGFEIAVKKGEAFLVMTTYSPLNGIYTGSNYDLVTKILRDDWGFEGMVMTDWWARQSDDGEVIKASRKNTTAMIRAQNDVYMVNGDADANSNSDNSDEGLAKGIIGRNELVRNAKNICKALRRLAVCDRMIRKDDEVTQLNRPQCNSRIPVSLPEVRFVDGVGEVDVSQMRCETNCDNQMLVDFDKGGEYLAVFTLKSDLSEASQSSFSVFENNVIRGAITINGTGGKYIEETLSFPVEVAAKSFVSVYFACEGIQMKSIKFIFCS